MDALDESLSFFQVLDIARCSEITDDGVVRVAQHCPNLEEITMFQCAVGDDALYALGSNCLRLRVCGLHPGAASHQAIEYLKRSSGGRVLV
jgi:hypothetical protein